MYAQTHALPRLCACTLACAILLGLTPLQAQSTTNTEARFRRLTQADGLIQTAVDDITQDSLGFIWLGTWDGLYRYDGQELRRFVARPFDPSSLSYSSVKALASDGGSGLWIGTDGGGIDHYDARTEQFSRAESIIGGLAQITRDSRETLISYGVDGRSIVYPDDQLHVYLLDRTSQQIIDLSARPGQPPHLLPDVALSMAHLPSGGIVVGALSGQLSIYAQDLAVQTALRQQFARAELPSGAVTALAVTQDRYLWMGGPDGLSCLDLQTNELRPLPLPLSQKPVTTLLAGLDGQLWIGTNDELIHFSPKGQIESFSNRPGEELSLLPGEILSLYIDRSEVLWVGTTEGLCWRSLQGNLFGRVSTVDPHQHFNSAAVWTMWKSPDHYLYFNYLNGIRRVSPSGRLDIISLEAVSAPLGYVYQIAPLSDSRLMLSSSQGELYTVDLPNPAVPTKAIRATKHALPSVTDQSLACPNPATDIHNIAWLTGAGSAGIIYACPDDPTFRTLTAPDSLTTTTVSSRYAVSVQLPNGDLYIGQYHVGLLHYSASTRKWRLFNFNANNPSSLASNVVLDLALDSKGKIWVATYGGGLCHFDPDTGTSTHYNSGNSGIPDDVVYCVAVDAHDRVWIGSNYGISALDPASRTALNFGLEHNLQNLEFNAGAKYVADDGEIFFGGIAGLNRFYPDSIINAERLRGQVRIVFTGLSIRGQRQTVDSLGPLRRSMAMISSIQLQATDRDFELFFSALDYAFPGAARIRYRLLGYDDTWTETKDRRSASFTNLPSGNYRFEVQATTGDFGYSGPASVLDIHIASPWYRTWLAYSTYAALVLAAAYLLYGFRQNRLRIQREQVDREREATQLRELNQAKSDFFANVSHEFRTPLTLVMGPLDTVLRQPEEAFAKTHRAQLQLARENAGRLHLLVEEILDISRLEAGQVQAHPQPIELATFLSALENRFAPLAAQAHLSLRVEAQNLHVGLIADPIHLERALANLLSNAIKFSSPGGLITLRMRLSESAPIDVTTSTAPVAVVSKQAPTLAAAAPDLEAAHGVSAAAKQILATPASANAASANPASEISAAAPSLATASEARLTLSGSPAPWHSAADQAKVLEAQASGNIKAWVVFEVEDQGRGIPEADLAHVFDRFYRVDESGSARTVGTGIGLSLAQELVRLEGGELSVRSQLGIGSVFTLTLPAAQVPSSLTSRALPTIETVATQVLRKLQVDEVKRAAPVPTANGDEAFDPEDRPCVLVVDDHAGIRDYIAGELLDRYRVLQAADGASGITLAQTELPDLVISDVMMPGRSGLELCEALKSSIETAFIPIILLTAKAAREDRLAGLHARADDYVPKPFDALELRARVDNLIDQRRAWRANFGGPARPGDQDFKLRSSSQSLNSSSSVNQLFAAQENAENAYQELEVPSTQQLEAAGHHARPAISAADRRWLGEVRAAIQAQLGNEHFSVVELATACAVSRSHLHRQLSELLNTSPSQLIKDMRLEEAAQLLQLGEGNVSEVAYGVGFKSVAHFSNAFTERFGCRPSQYGLVGAR